MLNKTEQSSDKKEPVVVKKYANRRLYNTETSTYVTLDDLATMVRAERDFVVFDAKTGEDLTHAVLTQIIVDEESKAGTQTLLPIPFLRQLIRFYGDTMERMVPSYLQVSLETLAKEQERFRKQFTTAFTPQGAFEAYQEQARKNLAIFENAMTMFTPFTPPTKPGAPNEPPRAEPQRGTAAPVAPVAASPIAKPAAEKTTDKPAEKRAQGGTELEELKAQLAQMQAKLEKLAEPNK